MRYPRAALRVLLCFLLVTSALLAQSAVGTITGAVRDSTGATIPNAKIVVTNTALGTTFSTDSGDVGVFTVPNLVPGSYSVRIEKEGFRPSTTTNLTINAGVTARVDAVLEVGAAAQAIEVSASAVQLQTENAKSQTVVTDKLIQDLPTVVGGNLRSPVRPGDSCPGIKEFRR